MRNNEEAVEILKKDIEHWRKIIGRFTRDSYWYNEGVKKIRALKTAVEAIKDLEDLKDNCIEFGKDYWSDRYEITETAWKSEDGKTTCTSFRITPKEKIDGDDY